MQKRARILDNKNMKRLHINRRGRSDINQSSSSTFFYIRMVVTWVTMVALDAMTGFRFELLWPTWLMVRAAVESIQMRNQHCVTTIANPTAARFSVLFVCVTATSDLICYLFIPIRMLIFLATTYVWISLYCHTQGGFLRTIATLYGGERSQSWSILLITCFIVAFELFLRIRITKFDYIFLFRSHPILISIFPNVTEWAGVSPVWPRSLNAFFGAHSIGYPAVLITVSLHYYFNEWKLRRKQGDVSNRNEQLFRILVESLPAEYEGPKDYTAAQCLEDDVYYLDPPVPSLQTMQAITAPSLTATPPTTTSRKNGSSVHKRSDVTAKKKKNGVVPFNSTPPNDKKKGKSLRGVEDLEDEDSDADDYSWRDQSGSEERRGIWIIRFICDAASWAFCTFISGPSSSSHKPSSSSSRRAQDEDDEEESTLGDDVSFEKKNGRTDSLTTVTTKSRANTMTSSASRSNQKQQQQQQKANGKTSHQNHHHSHQKTNGSSNGHARAAAVRDSSHDTNGSTNETDLRSMSRELETLRTELSSRRSLEDDYKLQVSMHESNESRLSQQLSNMKLKVEQMEIKCSTLERHRESDKSQLEQADRKYADLLGKKTEIEATLSAERKARNESAGKKIDVAEHQRERERQLESEIDKLRADLKSKEESNMRMEGELNGLRNYKEENDIEALHMELRVVREKSTQMEESLAGENKLKQSLFKCLGDARDNIKSLERKVAELQSKNGAVVVVGNNEILMNGHATENNNENDTFQTASDQSSPHQHSAMGSPVPSAKMPLSVNISNRGGSPFNEKISPPIGLASVLAATGPHPPDYMMATGGHPKQRYNEFNHMPTGEHRLFDAMPSVLSAPSPTGSNPDDDFLMNKGKFGAPSNPATRTA